MNIDNVVMEIIGEAEKKAKQIEERARIEREKILEEARVKINKEKEIIKKASEEKIKQIRTKELAISRVLAKKIEMSAKKESLEKVYKKLNNDAYDSIGRENILKKLFKQSNEKIDASTVYVNKNDIDVANKIFNGVDVREGDIDNGLIIENKDKTEKMDLSLHTIIKDLRKETVTDAAKILFGEEG